MALFEFDEDRFYNTLYEYLSPSEPIDREEMLRGRELELDKAIKALRAPGRHLFIYGERGVGKSSLAQTVGYLYQSSDNEPIKVECSQDSEFYRIIEYIAEEAIKHPKENIETTHQTRITAKILSYEYTHKTSKNSVKVTVDSMSDAVSVLGDIAVLHSEKPVIIIDEFDTITDNSQRALFAILIKHLSDKKIPIKLILTGIGKSLTELLGAHLSSPRQLPQLHLDRLHWNGRFEIIAQVARAFDIEISDDISFRIAGISDGFPHWIHSVCEKLLIEAYEDQQVIKKVTLDHYYAAIREVITDMNESLRAPYEKATMKDTDDFHHILWALADAHDSQRQFGNIYKSYLAIAKELSIPPIDKSTFSRRLASLRKQSHGSVVEKLPNQLKWYKYSESILRGYARLIAEVNGLTLNYESFDQPVTYTAQGRETKSSYNYANKGLENKIQFRSERRYKLYESDRLDY